MFPGSGPTANVYIQGTECEPSRDADDSCLAEQATEKSTLRALQRPGHRLEELYASFERHYKSQLYEGGPLIENQIYNYLSTLDNELDWSRKLIGLGFGVQAWHNLLPFHWDTRLSCTP